MPGTDQSASQRKRNSRDRGLKIAPNGPGTEWVLVGVWTVVLCFFLLWPSKGTLVDDVSEVFGGGERTDAVGHAVLAFFETAFLFNLIRHRMTRLRALLLAVGSCLILDLALEVAQIWIPARGFTLLDLSANWIGTGLFVLIACPILYRKTH